MKLGFSLNKDWAILGGSVILAITGLVYLHNRFSSYVPTIPGVSYGPGGSATGIYTGQGPYAPFPVANDLYQPTRGITGPVLGEAQSLGRQGIGAVQSMYATSGAQGRGAFRDLWTDVYQNKPTSLVTHDDPDKRVSLA